MASAQARFSTPRPIKSRDQLTKRGHSPQPLLQGVSHLDHVHVSLHPPPSLPTRLSGTISDFHSYRRSIMPSPYMLSNDFTPVTSSAQIDIPSESTFLLNSARAVWASITQLEVDCQSIISGVYHSFCPRLHSNIGPLRGINMLFSGLGVRYETI